MGALVGQQDVVLRRVQGAQHAGGDDDAAGQSGQRVRVRRLVLDDDQAVVRGHARGVPEGGGEGPGAAPEHAARGEQRAAEQQSGEERDGRFGGVVDLRGAGRPVAESGEERDAGQAGDRQQSQGDGGRRAEYQRAGGEQPGGQAGFAAFGERARAERDEHGQQQREIDGDAHPGGPSTGRCPRRAPAAGAAGPRPCRTGCRRTAPAPPRGRSAPPGRCASGGRRTRGRR